MTYYNVGNMLIPENILSDDNNLYLALFGSRLYGTNNDESDYDYIIIQKEYRPYPDPNIHCYTMMMFEQSVINGDIACLEVMFSDKTFWYVFNNNPLNMVRSNNFKPNIDSFRRNISMLTNNSWNKGKKKLIVIGDYDVNIALKSVFHSIRILDYAIQIMNNGKIVDYQSMNWLYTELFELAKIHDGVSLWNIINDRYRKIFNNKASEFRLHCPITKTTDKDIELRELLKIHGVFTIDLLNDIKAIYN